MNLIDDVLSFWFPERNKYQNFWFDRTKDEEISNRFEKHLLSLGSSQEERNKLCSTLNGKLCCIIIFDQFARNLNMKNYDEFAFNIAKNILDNNDDVQFDRIEYRLFILLPYRHKKQSTLLYFVLNKLSEYSNDFPNNLLINKFFKNTIINFTKLQDELVLYTLNEYPLNISFNMSCCDESTHNYFDNIESHSPYNFDNNMLYNTIKKFVIKNNIKAACISISGGVDSMVLSYILVKLLENKIITDLCGVHLNYGNRNIADDEANFIKKWCSCNKIPLIYRKIKHMKRETTEREFYESETKNIRFELYKIVEKELDYDGIFLGHHGDDVEENIMMNILKSKSLLEIDGMKEVAIIDNIHIFRPMLPIKKSDIYYFSSLYYIPYTVDTTPKESMRGILRKQVFPTLHQNLGLKNQFTKIITQTEMLSQIINKHVIEPIINSIVYKKNGCVIKNIKNINEYILEIIFKNVFHKLQFKMLKHSHFLYIKNKISNGKDCILNFGKNIIGCVSNNNLYIYLNLRNWKVNIIPKTKLSDWYLYSEKVITYDDILNDECFIFCEHKVNNIQQLKKLIKNYVKFSLIKPYLIDIHNIFELLSNCETSDSSSMYIIEFVLKIKE